MLDNWISVKDDLPPYYKEVLVTVRQFGVFSADLMEMKTGAGMKWRLYKKKNQIKIANDDVTHWMPYPMAAK